MTCDIQDLKDQACENKFSCLDDSQKIAVLLQMLCNIAGSGISGQQVFAGSGDPTTQVPANNAGTYYDYSGKVLWNWNPVSSTWE